MKKEIKEFCEKHNITIDQFYGKNKIEGALYLRSVKSIPEGFNPTVGGFLDLRSLKSIPKRFNPTVGGSLDLRSLTSIPEGFNPIVGCGLDLSSLTSIPKGFNPTVGGSLDLESLTSIPKGFNPTIRGYLNLRSITSIPEGFNPTVGGGLYLDSVTSIPKGFNPIVGGNLYLESVTSIPEGFNPTVGGYLNLSSLTSIPEGFNPTVGGSFDLGSVTSIPEGFNPIVGGNLYLPHNLKAQKTTNLPENYLFSWQNGKYIKTDGIFTEVVSKRGNVYRVKKINKDEIFYLITDGEKWSHGNTLKEAKTDLLFKTSNRKKEDFKHLTLKDKISFEDGIMAYRVITGACSFGVKNFINNRLQKKKSKYTISEIIDLTTNEYGNKEFQRFFAT